MRKAILSLKRLTLFSAPTLKRQPSDNVASFWGKILLGSEIQEKNAENNLLENQSNIKGRKTVSAPTLNEHMNEFYVHFVHIRSIFFIAKAVSAHVDLNIFANVWI